VSDAPSSGAAPFDKADAMPVRAAGSTQRAAPFDKAEASRQLAPEKVTIACDNQKDVRWWLLSSDPGLPSGRTRERRPVTLFDFDALLNGRAEIERIGGSWILDLSH
jgi:hypothetical protein